MISFVDLGALRPVKSNDFSISKEPMRFVSDGLYCSARFIMGGKHAGTLSCLQKILLSILSAFQQLFLEAGVQGCKSLNIAVLSLSSMLSE